jgi:hypothetical protein
MGADSKPWVKDGCEAPSYYEELFETDQKATVKFGMAAVWCCIPPTFQRLNLPFGHVGYADDSTVDDYLFVRLGKSPAPKQVKDADGIEPVWGEFRDKMINTAKSKIPAQCVCCCCSCITAGCWMPMFVNSYKGALKELVEEYAPKKAAVGITMEYFDMSGNYDYAVSNALSQKWARGVPMQVFGVTLEKGGAASTAPGVPVQIERT